MAQLTVDYALADQSGGAFRTELNAILAALNTSNKSTGAPSTQAAGQLWIDDTNDPTWEAYVHDGTDDIEALSIDTTNNRVSLRNLGDGSAAAPALAPGADTDTGFYFGSAAVYAAVAGVNRLTIDGTALVLNDGGGDYDFRVEGNGLSHLLFIDAGNGRVGVNTSDTSAGAVGSRFITASSIFPATDDVRDLGHGSYRWDDIYATNGTIQTSDATEKQNIADSRLGIDFVRALTPREFTRIGGSSGRVHYGLVAQEVKAVMDAQEIASADFAGWLSSEKVQVSVDPKTGAETVTVVGQRQGLRYEEFLAPLIAALQDVDSRLAALEVE